MTSYVIRSLMTGPMHYLTHVPNLNGPPRYGWSGVLKDAIHKDTMTEAVLVAETADCGTYEIVAVNKPDEPGRVTEIRSMGPTVHDYAEARLREIAEEIKELERERQIMKSRMRQYAGSMMLECERRASAAEPFQTTQIMSYEQKLLFAMDAANMSPEDFGELLAKATNPIRLEPKADAVRGSCRLRIRELPYGEEILEKETPK